MAAQAPQNGLRGLQISFALMTDPLYCKYAKIAKVLLNSLMRHLWYLTPQLVIFALADDDLEIESRKKILQNLLSFEQPSDGDFDREKPEPISQISPMSDLEDFVSEQSYLFFSKLKISQMEIREWDLESLVLHPSLEKFICAIKNTAVVNDRAETHQTGSGLHRQDPQRASSTRLCKLLLRTERR